MKTKPVLISVGLLALAGSGTAFAQTAAWTEVEPAHVFGACPFRHDLRHPLIVAGRTVNMSQSFAIRAGAADGQIEYAMDLANSTENLTLIRASLRDQSAPVLFYRGDNTSPKTSECGKSDGGNGIRSWI